MLKRLSSYLYTAQKLVELYNGEMPLAAFLKNYFSQNKKHGSTDRKYIAHLCYCYYRLGFALTDKNFDEKILVAVFLCHAKPNEYAVFFDEEWIINWNKNLDERLHFIKQQYNDFEVEGIYKNYHLIGVSDKKYFIKNHLIQPDLFVRIRPNYETIVKEKLEKNDIAFTQINANCLALNNRTKIDEILKINKEAVVQDYSSQQVETLMQLVKEQIKMPVSVWDCCAASGGKSILAKDVFGEMQLTVSDIRGSIIANLKKRFDDAGIRKYESFVADLSKPIHQPKKYNLIICDAPCTGSGTWARTPEELYFFKEKSINEFSLLQKNIATNALKYLQMDGYFLYITCSVFTKENEEVVEHLLLQENIKLVEQKYFKGFETKADTMFAALFKK